MSVNSIFLAMDGFHHALLLSEMHEDECIVKLGRNTFLMALYQAHQGDKITGLVNRVLQAGGWPLLSLTGKLVIFPFSNIVGFKRCHMAPQKLHS